MKATRRGRAVRRLVLLAVVVGVSGAAYFGLRGVLAPVRSVGCSAVVEGREVEVSPEQAGNAATITGVAVRRRLPARAATIAVATAMQESKLVNLDYGDRDSLGLFQQRPSQGWGTPEQVRDPVYATNAFYDVLVKIDGYRSMQITEVAQRVQRSAFPEAYADHEPDARVLASALSGFSPAALTCTLDEDSRPAGVAGVKPFQSALRRELTTTRSQALDGVAGVRLPTTDATATWATAQWSVAQAQRLGVARVYAGGKVWRRADEQPRWRPATGAPSGVTVLFDDAAPPRS
jgi:hypothetical protein